MSFAWTALILQDLHPMDINGKADPYLVLQLGSKRVSGRGHDMTCNCVISHFHLNNKVQIMLYICSNR